MKEEPATSNEERDRSSNSRVQLEDVSFGCRDPRESTSRPDWYSPRNSEKNLLWSRF